MDRKKFIKSSGIGLGLTLLPGVMLGQPKQFLNSIKPKNEPKVVKDSDGEVLNVIGDIQTHKLIGKDTNGQIVEWVDNVEPGAGIPPHIHTKEDEIFRVIKGEVEIMVNGIAAILKEGDIVFAPKGISHSWKVVGTEKAKMITSAFPAGIEFMFQELAQLPEGPPNFDKVAEICGRQGISFV
ncbi:MAG: cupin domain-containing protein [Maribacter sp.]